MATLNKGRHFLDGFVYLTAQHNALNEECAIAFDKPSILKVSPLMSIFFRFNIYF